MTSDHPRPRTLTAAARLELGLPAVKHGPYPWAFASLVVATASLSLVLASLWAACFAAAAIGFVILPLVRWFENRAMKRREDIYRLGRETTGRVVDVEPASVPGRADHIVRVEFRAGAALVHASVVGCPLAGRGLAPDDEVAVLYAPERPTECLVLRKITREIVDAVFEDLKIGK